MEQSVHFGHCRFDVDTGQLWTGTEEIRVTPRASAVLKALLSRAGELVTKDDLFASVWDGVAVGDDALTSCIQELRRALGDDPKQPRFIETRHRRGYRFIAPLQSAVAAVDPAPPAAEEISTIAVLPFADMSPGRDQDYLCEGLAVELISALTHIDGLRVVSRTASFQFRAVGADVRAVGQQLGAGTLLEGSVRKMDDRLRVTVQLVEVATGYHRWSERFDRTLDDVFAIQDEIAESVAASLRGGVLSRREKQGIVRPQTAVEAYEYYLRGLQHLPRMTKPDLERAAELFARAIALDANYGPAVAGLANVHATLYEWFGARDEDRIEAERCSQRALDLAPDLAEAHVARGYALSQSRRYDDAAREFERAAEINPHLFDAHYYYARTAFAHGDIARSAELFRKAGEVRREDYLSPMLEAQSLNMLERHDEAHTVALEGIRRAERILALNPRDGRALSLGSGALWRVGQKARAVEWSERAIELYPDDVSALLNGACLRARLGEKDAALDLLERVFARGWGKRDWIEHDPDYDSLRDSPRFQTLFARLR